jgi:hypothetical protein
MPLPYIISDAELSQRMDTLRRRLLIHVYLRICICCRCEGRNVNMPDVNVLLPRSTIDVAGRSSRTPALRPLLPTSLRLTRHPARTTPIRHQLSPNVNIHP